MARKKREEPNADTILKNKAAELGMSMDEYKAQIEVEKALEADKQLSARVQRGFALACRLKKNFVNQRLEEGLIMSCKIYRDEADVRIDYRLTSHTRGKVNLSKLYTLGFAEWK